MGSFLKPTPFYVWGVAPARLDGRVLGLIDMKTHQRFEPPGACPASAQLDRPPRLHRLVT
jgi:hypothetical protein